jgi:hypothetical protein
MNKEMKTTDAVKVGSLKQLQALLEPLIPCPISIDGVPVELQVKRLGGEVAERARAIVRKVQPPYNQARKDYEVLDPKYVEASEKAQDMARAVVVYYCCPVIAEGKACASDAEILAYVNSVLPVNLQRIIEATAELAGLRRVVEAANFTSPAGSES